MKVSSGGWPVIRNRDHWIDGNHALRVQIAHGTAALNVDAVDRAAKIGETIGEAFPAISHRVGTSQ